MEPITDFIFLLAVTTTVSFFLMGFGAALAAALSEDE